MAFDYYTLIIYPIIFILPAWVANGAPVIFGGKAPLDAGMKLGRRRIFGKHKTVRGTWFGLVSGYLIALIESLLVSPYLLVSGVMLTNGAILGDLLGSFAKRRVGLKEGSDIIGLDQYLFLIGGLLFALSFGTFPTLGGLVVIVVLTGVLHRGLNILAHMVKLKAVPW